MSATTKTDPPPPPPPVPPKGGGIHPQFGRFIGGSKLNDAYETVGGSGTGLFRFSTQRRHEKTLASSIEKTLRDARDSTTGIKFNGTLEPGRDNPSEIGKERFITLLKKRVTEHGQQTFYHIMDTNNKVVNLFENAHRFKLDYVVAEHERRMETNRLHESYDSIERDDFQLSRGVVVESFFSESFQDKIEIRFSHREDFELLPGSCLFMLALETCNASVFHDVEGAKKKLEALDLNSYPGENVTDLVSEAQRLLKIMAGAYAVPVNTGSTLLMKLTSTSSEIFNRKIFALLDHVMTLESESELQDPRLFAKDDSYKKYGPLALVATIQASHGILLSQQRWPALASSLPWSNNSSVSTAVSTGAGTVALNGRKCYRCQCDHLVRDCPQPAPANGTGTGTGGTAKVKPPLAAWKYVKPNVLTVPRVDSNGKTWKFCTKCKCRATGSVGIYQLSHWDSEHVDNYRRPGSTPAATPASLGDTSEAPPEVPEAASSTAPQSNLTSVANPNPIPPGPPDVTVCQVEFADDSHDLDEIEFTGMWCSPVEDDTPSHALMWQVQLYCTMVDCPVDAEATITISAPCVFEREMVDELLVETVEEDEDELDDQDDEDDITVVIMFPDPDHDDEDDNFVDYPSTDDEDDDADDETYFDDEELYEDAVTDTAVDPWARLSPSVRYDLEQFVEDEFYDAYEFEPTMTLYKGGKFFDAIEPPLDVVPFCPSPPWYHWLKLCSFWVTTLFWDTIVYFVSAPTPLLRRIRRRWHSITVPGYPKTWMLFTSCLMIGMDAFRGHAPPFIFARPTPQRFKSH